VIIKTTEIKPMPVDIVQDVICNNCGESCMKQLGGTDMKENYGVSIRASGGYCSDHLSDGVTYQFELCEKCIATIIKGLKSPPDETCE